MKNRSNTYKGVDFLDPAHTGTYFGSGRWCEVCKTDKKVVPDAVDVSAVQKKTVKSGER